MDKFQHPEPLSLQGNLAENWRRWRQRFELYMTASGNDSKEEGTKSAILLHVAGPEALEVYNTFTWEEEADKRKVAKIMEQFESYCMPRKNVVWERHVFNCRTQQPGETVDQYVTDLRCKAKTCEFGTLTDSLIRDRIVYGILSDKTRGRLLKDANLSLAGAIDICRADEATAVQMKSLAGNNEKDRDLDMQLLSRDSRSRQSGSRQCGNCGGKHTPQQRCPAIGEECHKCGRRNHYARVCRSKTPKSRPQLHELGYDNEPSDNDMVIDAVSSGQAKEDWHTTIKVNEHNVTFKIDTGAQCNVISKETYNRICQQPLRKSRAKLVTFGGHRMDSLGKAIILCEHKNKYSAVEFEVLSKVSNVLGLKTSTQLKLVKRIETVTNDPLREYADTFSGLGCITDVTHHIKTDPTCKPVVHPPRKVPVTIRAKVKEELARMEQLGVVERIREPTDWVNSMVTVMKPNGKLRLCIDPRDLNKAIKREHYPMKTVEEIVARIPNAKVFSVLDASSGFWQVKLDRKSAKLCTFNTPFGRYMFTRLPFGISSAPDVFQTIMSEMFEDIDGVEVVVDDVLIWGETEDEHDLRLWKVLERAKQRNLKLNKEKSQIKRDQVCYLGHIIGKDGVKPDPKKVEAVVNLNTPTEKEELQRFLGMTTYLAKFIPNYSQVAAPLRILLEKSTEWHWEREQEDSFQQLKKLITSTPVLKFFDPQKPTTLSVDASSRGLGAVLLQNEGPIAYASKSLTSCQQNYAQIEKEMLAIVFGCTKFHDFLYGLPSVRVETDHKPLETILKKPLHLAPTRLQRMIMSIQKYPIAVEYKAGKHLFVADTLSRAPLLETADELEFKQYDINVLCALPISESKLQVMKEKTKDDESLQQLLTTVQSGWPKNKADVPPGARPYWNYRDEISHHDGLLFKGEKVVIPTSMRTDMLKIIHSSHLGMEKCKRRAKDVIYWPGMSTQIEDVVQNCEVCARYQRSNVKEPLLCHDPPHRPWEKVGADLCEFGGRTYLVLVDYYSNFIEVDQLKETTSAKVITRCKAQFARHGIPDTFVTDNGPQFSSQLFCEFSSNYQFKHLTSSPLFPQSNGKAEKAVQIVKNILKKARDDKQDPYLALLALRNTPIDDEVGSPVQQLMGRRTRTLLPTTNELLLPKSIQASTVRKAIVQRQQRQKHYYDRLSQPLAQLKVGDNVTFQCSNAWKPATISGVAHTPRSYMVTTPEGQTYRRNRRHIRRSEAHVELDDSDDTCNNSTRQESHACDHTDGTSPGSAAEDAVGNTSPTEDSSPIMPEEIPTVPPLRRSTRVVSKPNRYQGRIQDL